MDHTGQDAGGGMATPLECRDKIRDLGWPEVAGLWEDVKRRETPGWEAGKAFEYLVLRAFELDGAFVRWPYIVRDAGDEIEELDGAIYAEGLSCIIECKDWGRDLNVGPISKLRNQLLRRPAGVVGLVFSSSDFTDSATYLAKFSSPQTILLWTGEEIDFAIGLKQMVGPLMLKYRNCVEEGAISYDFRNFYPKG